ATHGDREPPPSACTMSPARLVGAVGIEPTNGRVRACCLTVWRRPNRGQIYFGCGVIRRYGFGALKPGKLFFASSSLTEPEMITSSPCFQLAGVATLCLAV